MRRIVLLLALCVAARAEQPMPDEAAIDAAAVAIVRAFAAGDSEGMAAAILAHTATVPGLREQLAGVMKAAAPKLAAYGRPLGCDYLGRVAFAGSLQRRWYLCRFERSASVIALTAYHGPQGWWFKAFAVDADRDDSVLAALKDPPVALWTADAAEPAALP